MGFWADSLKFIKSKVFKEQLENGGFKVAYSNEASHSKVWVVSSFEGLKEMIQINPSSLIGISIRTKQEDVYGIVIPTTTGEVFIPSWSYGTLAIDELGDASLHLTAYTGGVFHLWYNAKNGEWVKGIINANHAKSADGLSANGALCGDVIEEDGLYCVYCRLPESDVTFVVYLRPNSFQSYERDGIRLAFMDNEFMVYYADGSWERDANITIYRLMA